MNRKHTIESYIELTEKLKKINPFIKFSSDFIIGYPGETNEDFNLTLELLKKIEFINSYSFIFSPRPGTPAARLKMIDKNISKERLVTFQKIASKIKLKFKKKLFGKKISVLFENKLKDRNEFFGRDEYLNSVIVKSHKDLKGTIKTVRIIDGNQNTLFGEIKNKMKAA